jgi:hypothetical protein
MIRALTRPRALESVDETLDRFIVQPDAFLFNTSSLETGQVCYSFW